MPPAFVSEPITPLDGSFDTAGMSRGEPGVPHKFRWRTDEFEIAEILESWKEHGDCSHGSGEQYVRKHGFRIRTVQGPVAILYFQRSFGRGKFRTSARWWIYTIEDSRPRPAAEAKSRPLDSPAGSVR